MIQIRWSWNADPWADPSGWLDNLEEQASCEPWLALAGVGPAKRVRIEGLSAEQAKRLVSLYVHEIQGLAQWVPAPKDPTTPTSSIEGQGDHNKETQHSILGEVHVYLDGDPLRLSRLMELLEREPLLFSLGQSIQAWWKAVSVRPVPWEVRGQVLDWSSRPLLMGIVNVTPDSFSDGGRFDDPQAAIEHGLSLLEEGAVILDVGGESTRPGSAPVSEQEELRRILPVIEGLRRHSQVPLSIDTYKSVVAREALSAGADIINDVSGLRFDRALAQEVAKSQSYLILMHSRHTPEVMQDAPHYDALWSELGGELSRSLTWAIEAGVAMERIALDPGLGFGKRLRDNLRILRELEALRSFGLPLLVGASRKSFLGHYLRERDATKRLEGSLAAAAAAMRAGAQILRVHDVVSTRKMLDVLAAIFCSF